MADLAGALTRAVNLGRTCRDAQRRYLQSRSHHDKRVMRDWERRFDRALEECARRSANASTSVPS
jgi:hypothetical protein